MLIYIIILIIIVTNMLMYIIILIIIVSINLKFLTEFNYVLGSHRMRLRTRTSSTLHLCACGYAS